MHMISEKDLSKAEMDTLTKSCSPAVVITANGEVQAHVGAIVYVKELENSWQWMFSITRQQCYRSHVTQCSTENFVPIVVPGLSSSLFLELSSKTSMMPSRQEIDHHPTSSSSSSTSPTTTVSSDSEDWSKGRLEWDGFLSSICVKWTCWTKRTMRPVVFRNNGMAARIHRNSRGGQSSWMQRLTRQFFSGTIFRAPRLREVRIWVSTVLILTSLKTEIAKSARGPKWQGPPCRIRIGGAVLRAEDFGDQSSQWKLWISKQSSICNRGAGLCHPMDPVVSVQNKNFSRNTKELAKVPGAR